MPSKNNGSGGARRAKKATKKPRAGAAPVPRPSNRDKLGQFKPGHSGNPEGRPKGPSLLAALKHRLAEHPEEVDKIIDQLINMAVAGELKAIEIVGDRLDGKPTQRSEISGPDGGPVLNVIHQDFPAEPTPTNGTRQAIIDGLNGK